MWNDGTPERGRAQTLATSRGWPVVSRADRICRGLPDWMLPLVVTYGLGEWPGAAYVEIWRRKVEPELAAPLDDSGPWPCVMPRGWH